MLWLSVTSLGTCSNLFCTLLCAVTTKVVLQFKGAHLQKIVQSVIGINDVKFLLHLVLRSLLTFLNSPSLVSNFDHHLWFTNTKTNRYAQQSQHRNKYHSHEFHDIALPSFWLFHQIYSSVPCRLIKRRICKGSTVLTLFWPLNAPDVMSPRFSFLTLTQFPIKNNLMKRL